MSNNNTNDSAVEIDNDNITAETTLIGDETAMTLKQKLSLFISVAGVIITGSAMGVLIPLCTIYIPSVYIILLVSTIEMNFIFFLVASYFHFVIDPTIFKLGDWQSIITIVLAGFFNSLMCIAKIYASNPNRTSPIMQSTLASTTIVFSVLFSKLLLNKVVTYKWVCIVLSIFMLIGSVLMPLIYESIHTHIDSEYLWVLCYLFGVICRGLYITLQEKYFIQTDNFTTQNKIKLLFYVEIIQLLTVGPSYGFEHLLGNSTDPNSTFVNSTKILFTEPGAFFTFHGFVLTYFLYLGFSIWLNIISSNYVVMTSVVITPAVTIFFQIFNNLAPDIYFPLYIIIPSLVLSILSTILWIYGENNEVRDENND